MVALEKAKSELREANERVDSFAEQMERAQDQGNAFVAHSARKAMEQARTNARRLGLLVENLERIKASDTFSESIKRGEL